MENMDKEDPRRVKFGVTRMKSHAALWWDNLQNTWIKQGKKIYQVTAQDAKEFKAKFYLQIA